MRYGLASTKRLIKSFQNLKGLDLRSSDLLREQGAATQILNADLRQTGALNKRKGFQILQNPSGGFGTTSFGNVALTTGVITEELLTVDDDLHKMADATFTITYTGPDNAYYDVYLDTGEVYFDVYDNNIRKLNSNLGTGLETSPIAISALIIDINNLTNFTCSGSTATNTPAAFIPVQLNISVGAVSFKYWTQVDTPSGYTTPFSTHYAARNDADFQNASFAEVSDILLISNGYDDLHKYDGRRVYKAGLPKADTPTAPITGSGGAWDTVNTSTVLPKYPRTVRYKVEIEYTDNKENITYGTISEFVEVVITAATDTVNFTYTELLSNSGFDVDGDLKYNLYRTDPAADATGTSSYHLVHTALHGDTIPIDDTGIVALGGAFVRPFKPRTLPPKGRYIDVWRGQAIITGIRDDVNNVYYSDIDSAEYFPVDNTFLVTGQAGGKTSGVRSLDNTLYIFKNNSIFAITGDLGTDNFVVDNVSREGIGCLAHATIEELNGEVWFLSNIGVYSINTQGIKERSSNIKPKFQSGHPFLFNKATAYNWVDNNKYILCMPSISDIAGEYYSDSDTEVFVYDMHWGAWFQWDGIEPVGGMAEVDGKIYFISRELNSASSTVKQYLKRIHSDGLSSDYVDHASAISFSYKSHWETLGEPSIYKKFLRIKMHSLDASLNDFETDQFEVSVDTEHNYEPASISSFVLDFSGGAEGWGSGPWGLFPWGETRLPSLKSKLSSQKAKSLRVIFTNDTAKENILISGYELEVVAPYSLEIKD